MTDERLLKALAKQIEEHDLNANDLVLVPRKELEDLEYKDESETEELANPSSKEETLSDRLRQYKSKRSGKWDGAVKQVEEELESLENEDRETEELEDSSPTSTTQSPQKEDPQEDEDPRARLKQGFLGAQKAYDGGGKSPFEEARQSREESETESLSKNRASQEDKTSELEHLSSEELEEAESLSNKVRFLKGRKKWEHLARGAEDKFEELTGVSHNDAHL